MAIGHFGPPSNDDFVSLAAFADFDSFSGSRGDTKSTVHVLPQQPSPPTTSDGSPDSSAPVAPMLADDDEDDDSGSEEFNGGKKRHATGGAPAGKRGKASSAERRATHNAIERARRESLNGRFLELANALPTMASVKRPSKSVIVNKSLEWIYESQIREHALVRENNALRAELNDMRARLQMPPLANMSLASDPARFAAGQPTQNNSQLSVPMSPAATTPIDSYFTPAAFPALGALHHQMQHPALSSVSAGPASAPVLRQHEFNLASPFDVQHLAGGAGTTAQPLSPGSKSDNGSETAASAGHNGAPEVKPESGAADGSNRGAVSDQSVAPITVSQADAMAALQAAHFQQQQFAAFAAAAAAASQTQNRAGQTAPAMTAWPMAGTFLF